MIATPLCIWAASRERRRAWMLVSFMLSNHCQNLLDVAAALNASMLPACLMILRIKQLCPAGLERSNLPGHIPQPVQRCNKGIKIRAAVEPLNGALELAQ